MGHSCFERVTVGVLRQQALLLLLTVSLLMLHTLAGGELMAIPKTVQIPERGEVIGYSIVSGTNRFSIVPPPRWRVRVNQKEGMIFLTPRDLSASVSIEIEAGGTNNVPIQDVNVLRDRLLARWPESRITRAFKAPSGIGEGLAFDFERTGKSKIKVSNREVAIPSQGALVTFILSAPANRFDKLTVPFGALLTSCRREPGVFSKP